MNNHICIKSEYFFYFQFLIIEFDGDTFHLLLEYLHTGSCHISCLNIPGLICAAEHYDLPELLQACFHHAKQFIRTEVVSNIYCVIFVSLYFTDMIYIHALYLYLITFF